MRNRCRTPEDGFDPLSLVPTRQANASKAHRARNFRATARGWFVCHGEWPSDDSIGQGSADAAQTPPGETLH